MQLEMFAIGGTKFFLNRLAIIKVVFNVTKRVGSCNWQKVLSAININHKIIWILPLSWTFEYLFSGLDHTPVCKILYIHVYMYIYFRMSFLCPWVTARYVQTH